MKPMSLYDMLRSVEDSLGESQLDLHHCVDENRSELGKIVGQAIGHIRAARTLMKKAEWVAAARKEEKDHDI